MESPDFPEKVREYLEERFKGEIHTHFMVDKSETHWPSPEGKDLRWAVHTSSPLGCSCVEEDIEGNIWVESGTVESPYYSLTEGYNISDLDLVDRIIEELKDRNNWKKYENTFRELIAGFYWDDEIAKIVAAKTGVKIVHYFPESMPPDEYTYFCSVFDGKDMADEQKMEEIKTRVEAIILAYRMRKDPKAEGEFYRRMGLAKGRRKKNKSKKRAE